MLKVYYYRVYLAEALLDDPNHNFWLEVCWFNGNHKFTPTPVIDGV